MLIYYSLKTDKYYSTQLKAVQDISAISGKSHNNLQIKAKNVINEQQTAIQFNVPLFNMVQIKIY